jgi:hypothetical protein
MSFLTSSHAELLTSDENTTISHEMTEINLLDLFWVRDGKESGVVNAA